MVLFLISIHIDLVTVCKDVEIKVQCHQNILTTKLIKGNPMQVQKHNNFILNHRSILDKGEELN